MQLSSLKSFKLPLLLRHLLSLVLTIIFIAHVAARLELPFVKEIENRAYDLRLMHFMPHTVDPRIVIVDIDEKSLMEEGHWPWPRDRLAKLIHQLFEQYQIALVGFDMVFAEADRDPTTQLLRRHLQTGGTENSALQHIYTELEPLLNRDQQFADSFSSGTVVLGYFFGTEDHQGQPISKGMLPFPALTLAQVGNQRLSIPLQHSYTANLPELQFSAASAGFVDTPLLDTDGVIRRVAMLQQYGEAIYESLSLAMLRALFQLAPLQPHLMHVKSDYALEALSLADMRIPVDERGAVLVPYRGAYGSFPYVSAADVIAGEADRSILKDSIVLVGSSASGLLDLRSTPMQNAYPGVEVHANVISGVLDGRILHQPSYMLGVELVQVALIGLVMVFLLAHRSPLFLTTGTLFLGGAVILLSTYFWQREQIVMPVAAAMVLLLLQYLLFMSYGYFVERRGKEKLSSLFGQYVPPELVDEMNQNPTAISLSGECRDMTVLFSDVRGFTTLSEGLGPTQLTQMMNQLLTPLTASIHQFRGTIDKYMGDCVMAFWGAPLTDDLHAQHGIKAALDMVKRLESINQSFASKGWPTVNIGVGLNTGNMNVGNMGSEFRMAYTVLGDAVNLGSRLEGLTKHYGVNIIISESTKNHAQEYCCRFLDRVRVKGKQEPVDIYEPIALQKEISDEQRVELENYHRAIEAYCQQQWDKSEEIFLELMKNNRKIKCYDIYLKRISYYRDTPPGANWDRVFTHTSK